MIPTEVAQQLPILVAQELATSWRYRRAVFKYTIKQEEISQDVFFNYESDTVNNNLRKYIINILSRRYLDQSDRIEVLAAYDLYASNKKYRDSIS